MAQGTGNYNILSNYNISQSPEFIINSSGLFGSKVSKTYLILAARSLGYNSTSVMQDVCDYLDTTQNAMNTPTTGQTLYIVSTSANDTSAGTGVRTVDYVYLDGSGNEQKSTATMNGTTLVSLGTGFSAIQFMGSNTVGSSGVAVGNISISSTNGAATVATTFERITAGGNKSLSGRYKVPSGYTAYLKCWDISKIGGAIQDLRLNSDVSTYNRSILTGVFNYQDRVILDNSYLYNTELNYLKFPENSTIKISTVPSATGAANKIDGHFFILLIQN